MIHTLITFAPYVCSITLTAVLIVVFYSVEPSPSRLTVNLTIVVTLLLLVQYRWLFTFAGTTIGFVKEIHGKCALHYSPSALAQTEICSLMSKILETIDELSGHFRHRTRGHIAIFVFATADDISNIFWSPCCQRCNSTM